MKAILIIFALCACALAQNNPLDLTVGGAYIGTGTFTTYASFAVPPYTPFGPPSVGTHVWWSDPENGRFAQDLGTGGFFLYLPDKSFVVRGGVCFPIAHYNSSVLLKTYAQATSYSFDSKADNVTYFGVHASTCQTALSQNWRMGNRNIKEWIFVQKTALQIPPGVNENFPDGLNTCLSVRGDLEFDEIVRYKRPNNPIPFPALPAACVNPAPVDYCSVFYFPPGNQCDYSFYPYLS